MTGAGSTNVKAACSVIVETAGADCEQRYVDSVRTTGDGDCQAVGTHRCLRGGARRQSVRPAGISGADPADSRTRGSIGRASRRKFGKRRRTKGSGESAESGEGRSAREKTSEGAGAVPKHQTFGRGTHQGA